ncbi:MAG: ABC transporter permease subunit [Candidatus Cloacimonetes bacterium]|nr:ABC transporter permease subunit [Candidatus Cloacimonadota bacterium]
MRLGGSLAGFIALPPLALLLAVSLDVPLVNVWSALLRLPALLPDFFATLARVTLVALGAWLAAMAFARLLSLAPVAWSLTQPLVQFARHVSPFAWFPFAIIWFGLGEAPAVFVLFVALFFPALVAARTTLEGLPVVYIEEARVSGATEWQIALRVELPLLAGPLLGLLRVLWGLGWTAGIAVEMLGVRNGMGFRLLDFRYLQQHDNMIATLLVMGFAGLLVDLLLRMLEERFAATATQ